MSERLLNAITDAYVSGQIEIAEFEKDITLVLAGGRPGEHRTRYSTEEPAGPLTWFEPKYYLIGRGGRLMAEERCMAPSIRDAGTWCGLPDDHAGPHGWDYKLGRAVVVTRGALGCSHVDDPTFDGCWCAFCDPLLGGDSGATE